MPNSYALIITSGILTGIVVSLLSTFLLKSRKAKQVATDDLKNTSFVFSGNLKQTNLLEAIQFLEIGRREGILHIYSGRRKGYLIFSKGSVIDAFYRNNTGREAVIQMFEIDEGDFYFEPKTICQPRIITESILDLAFELNDRHNNHL
jgi:hypothetical protein